MYLCFEIAENPNTYQNPVKADKTRQIGFDLGGYSRVQVLLPCLFTYLSRCNYNTQF